MLKRFAIVLGIALCTGFAPRVVAQGDGVGDEFLARFVEAVRDSDRIVVTSHHNEYDVYDELSGKYVGEHIVVATRELDAAARAAFLAKLATLDPVSDPPPGCLFSPHHAIEFHDGGKHVSTVEICFTCGDLYWDAANLIHPRALLTELYALAGKLGLEPGREWASTAVNRRKQVELGFAPEPPRDIGAGPRVKAGPVPRWNDPAGRR